MKTDSGTFRVAEFAGEFGLITRTIRFYGHKRLIPPVPDGQRRVYRARNRVPPRLIMRAKRLGLFLEETAKTINLYNVDPSQQAQQAQLRPLLEKITECKRQLNARLSGIRETLGGLERFEAQSKAPLNGGADGACRPG